MSFTHRTGWVNSNDSIAQIPYIEQLQTKGLKYNVVLQKAFGKNGIPGKGTLIDHTDWYKIYQLNATD